MRVRQRSGRGGIGARALRAGVALALGLGGSVCGHPAAAQTTTMPSTLRYGSGLVDVPVATVLPHMAVTGTFSGFFLKLDRTARLDAQGNPAGYGPGIDRFYRDGSVALGILDRLEVGTTFQSMGSKADGGDMWGLFGRVEIVRPTEQGLGLAAGFRRVSAPDFGDGRVHQPPRLGFPDVNFPRGSGGAGRDTRLSWYGVASAHMRGSDGGLLPRHDLTFVLGYGTGMFREDGGVPDYYGSSGTGGWFLGSAIHVSLGDARLLALMGEYDGFDVNLGAQLDLGGIRLGVQRLGVNHGAPPGGYDSPFLRPKLGILVSVAFCPAGGRLLCDPRLMDRPERDVVQLPAPPPDTVVVTREVPPPLPTGTPALVCLSTGENVAVRVTAQGDTLVGPARTPVASLRPGVGFDGVYAGGEAWYEHGSPISLDGRAYEPGGEAERRDCRRIARVGTYRGIPLFAPQGEPSPARLLLVPVRPGVWRPYRPAGKNPEAGRGRAPTAP